MRFLFLLLVMGFSGINSSTLFGQGLYYNQQSTFLLANNQWCFGDSAGLDFSSGSARSFMTKAHTISFLGVNNTSSVADPVTGKLQFYTTGRFFFKSNGQLMTNGILRDTSWNTCIVPIVNEPKRFYVFSLNTPDSIQIRRSATNQGRPWPTGLFYSIVDMNRDNGRGDVDPAFQNILLDNDLPSLSMISVLSDQCDIWLLVYYISPAVLKAYHITAQGINPSPVVSQLPVNGTVSLMTISSDRKKLALVTKGVDKTNPGRIYIAQFNTRTGTISNTIQIGLDSAQTPQWGQSLCFSPDNTKLYVQSGDLNGVNGSPYANIYQYEMGVYDSAQIKVSKKFIARSSIFGGYLKLYNDTIYVSGRIGGLGGAKFISRISRPNLNGSACLYEDSVIRLTGGSTNAGQPFNTEVVWPKLGYDTSFFYIDSALCVKDNVSPINIQPPYKGAVNGYIWNTGDTTPSIHISESGIYKAFYTNEAACKAYSATFNITYSDIAISISVDRYVLKATGGPFTSYQWLLDGIIIKQARDNTHSVRANGAYQVIVTNAEGCVDTSEIYWVSNVSDIDDYTAGAPFVVYPNPATDLLYVEGAIGLAISLVHISGKVVMDQQYNGSISMGHLPEGIYLLQIRHPDGRLLRTEKVIRMTK